MIRFAVASPEARAAAVVCALLVALLVALILAAGIALAGLGQLNGAIDPARVPIWFWHYREVPEVRRWLTIGVVSAVLIEGVFIAAVALRHRRSLHGDARWASPSEQKRAGLSAPSGVVLGHGARGLLIADGPDHVIVYAPTRTGKGVGVVIPNLLAWPGSVVVLDIKRENFQATAGYRAQNGQTVLVFDPLDRERRTARYNPLGHINRNDPVAVLDELQRLAVMLFPTQVQTDPFWAEAARTGFIGVGTYVAAVPDHPFSLGEIFRQLTDGDPRERFPKRIEALRKAGTPLPGPCVAALNDFCASSENTFASIRQSITTRMGLFLNPLADAATSASDFDLADLRKGRLSLYLGASPDNLARVAPLYSLLFQQLVDLNSRTLPSPEDTPTLVVLDEFARLGAAPVLAHAFSWVAGYGLRLLPVIQSPAQLRGLYGPDVAEEILTNCGIEVVFAPKDVRIARELSDRLGFYTYAGRSLSRPKGLSPGRRSVTVSDQRRALMLPQELLQMPARDLIILKAGVPPVRGRKIRYYRDAAFRRRLRPPPVVPVAPSPTMVTAEAPSPLIVTETDMDLDAAVRTFTAEGCPPPPIGASEAQMVDWLDHVLGGPDGPAGGREP